MNDIITRARKQTIDLHFDVAELTLENIVREAERLVEYARSKGAPDDAVVELQRDPMYQTRNQGVYGPPEARPHDARIIWVEDEYRVKGGS